MLVYLVPGAAYSLYLWKPTVGDKLLGVVTIGKFFGALKGLRGISMIYGSFLWLFLSKQDMSKMSITPKTNIYSVRYGYRINSSRTSFRYQYLMLYRILGIPRFFFGFSQVYPPESLDDGDRQRIRMLAMPDCNTTQIGDCFYCFR